MTNTFGLAVSRAHSVLSAYNRGADTIPALAHRAGLSLTEVVEWCNILQLPIVGPNFKHREPMMLSQLETKQ